MGFKLEFSIFSFGEAVRFLLDCGGGGCRQSDQTIIKELENNSVRIDKLLIASD